MVVSCKYKNVWYQQKIRRYETTSLVNTEQMCDENASGNCSSLSIQTSVDAIESAWLAVLPSPATAAV